MKVQVVSNKKKGQKAEALIVFAYQDAKKAPLSGVQKIQQADFSAKVYTTRFYRQPAGESFDHILMVGLGDTKKIQNDVLRQAAAVALKELKAQNISKASVHLASLTEPWRGAESLRYLTEGFLVGDYSFDDYKKTKSKKTVESIDFISSQASAAAKKAVSEGEIIADSICFSRRIADTPGNLMTPQQLASETVKKAKGTGLQVSVWDKARIKKEKMGGLLGVSLGSDVDPRFIIMKYNGAGAGKKPVCFVGKGLTFDSGGISIKPSAKMDEMKYDMCGGANVISGLLAIARLKLKVNVLGLVPSSENMPGPLANKPGDILRARNGKTVEVLNTDAEGRLILMDALSYANEQKPVAIFDAATLTGAMVVALGNTYTGFFTRSKDMHERVSKAGERAGENLWPMPIHDDYVDDMRGIHADLSNISSGRGAGSSTAAAFLEQFVDPKIPWTHFDIAGTAWACGNRLKYCHTKGATGVLVRTFVELAKSYAA